jgi:hypothetical protein
LLVIIVAEAIDVPVSVSKTDVYETRAVVRPWWFPRQKWKSHTDLGIMPLLRHTGAALTEQRPPKVFISYSHDTVGFCRSTQTDGIDAEIACAPEAYDKGKEPS